MENNKAVLSKEVATADIERWLSHKKIGQSKRENFAGNIKVLTEAIQDGYLIVTEKGELKQKLKFPIEGDVSTREFVYKPRLTTDETFDALKTSDGTGGSNILCYLSALTGEVKAMFGKLDTEDYAICNSIVVFFL